MSVGTSEKPPKTLQFQSIPYQKMHLQRIPNPLTFVIPYLDFVAVQKRFNNIQVRIVRVYIIHVDSLNRGSYDHRT